MAAAVVLPTISAASRWAKIGEGGGGLATGDGGLGDVAVDDVGADQGRDVHHTAVAKEGDGGAGCCRDVRQRRRAYHSCRRRRGVATVQDSRRVAGGDGRDGGEVAAASYYHPPGIFG